MFIFNCMKSKQLRQSLNRIFYTSNMLRTPKTYKPFRLSDFQPTNSMLKSDSIEKEQSSEDLDNLLTIKRYPIFLPLKDRILPKDEFKGIKNNRARIIDWFLQIFSAYNLGWECFWMTVQLLDSLIAKFDYVSQNNIHLVGIVCCFIVAKYLGKTVLTLNHVVAGLGHHKFSERDVIMEEQQILLLIFSKSNFQRNNVYSYLMEKHLDLPIDVLAQAMKMMTVAMMRPDISFQEISVGTYNELVSRIVLEIACNRRVPILQAIHEDMIKKFGSTNIAMGDKMSFP